MGTWEHGNIVISQRGKGEFRVLSSKSKNREESVRD
jgi:hypothetical protein